VLAVGFKGVGFKGTLEGGAGRIFFVETIASLAFSVRVRF
jgi:hypothetical protein